MTNMLSRPYLLLAADAIILLVLAALAGRAAADFHLDDTYFIVPVRRALITLGACAGALFVLCALLKNRLRSATFGLIYSAGFTMLLAAIVVLLYQAVHRPGRGFSDDVYGMVNRSQWTLRLLYALAIWQLAIPANLIASLAGRSRS